MGLWNAITLEGVRHKLCTKSDSITGFELRGKLSKIWVYSKNRLKLNSKQTKKHSISHGLSWSCPMKPAFPGQHSADQREMAQCCTVQLEKNYRTSTSQHDQIYLVHGCQMYFQAALKSLQSQRLIIFFGHQKSNFSKVQLKSPLWHLSLLFIRT